MDTAFQWNDSYSVKAKAMDDQHKRLFEIIDELYTAMRAGHGEDIAGEVLGRLINYTVEHFAAEEKLMEKNGYTDLAAHRAEHKALTDKVKAFKKDFDSGSRVLTLELMTFLQDWLTNHIQSIDKKYGTFLSAKGVQ
jgi:hemerythrin